MFSRLCRNGISFSGRLDIIRFPVMYISYIIIQTVTLVSLTNIQVIGSGIDDSKSAPARTLLHPVV